MVRTCSTGTVFVALGSAIFTSLSLTNLMCHIACPTSIATSFPVLLSLLISKSHSHFTSLSQLQVSFPFCKSDSHFTSLIPISRGSFAVLKSHSRIIMTSIVVVLQVSFPVLIPTSIIPSQLPHSQSMYSM